MIGNHVVILPACQCLISFFKLYTNSIKRHLAKQAGISHFMTTQFGFYKKILCIPISICIQIEIGMQIRNTICSLKNFRSRLNINNIIIRINF
jgi:hypothetical protein